MTHRDRMRRVVLLCASFARNLAFYRVGQSDAGKALLSPSHPAASFWRQANSNFLDIAVLEWCKLLGDKKGEYYWSRTVSGANVTTFKNDLLAHVKMTEDVYAGYIKEMRNYRDKFVAHLDVSNTMQIPMLDTAHTSVSFYHSHLVTHEAQEGELAGIGIDTPDKFRLGYEQCVEEARAVLRNVKNHTAICNGAAPWLH